MIKITLDIALLALLAFVVFRLAQRYRAAEGTPWQKVKTAALGSYTLIVQYIAGVLTIVAPYIESIANALNLPEVSQFVHDYLPTDASARAVFWILVLTIVARLRTLGK